MSGPEFPTPVLRPVFVSILGQEFSRVQLDRRPVGCGLSATSSGLSGLLEGVNVDPELSMGTQDDLFVPQAHIPGGPGRTWLENPAQDVNGPSQVVGCGALSEMGPEPIHADLAVHGMAGREGEQLE